MLDDNFDTLDLVDFPVFVLDVQSGGGYIYRKSNIANVEMTGIPAREMEGKSPANVFPLRIHKALEKNYDRALKRRRKIQYEVLIPLPTGERRLKTSLVPTFGEAGDVVRLVGSSIDVSERYESAERRLATDASAHQLLKESELYVSMAAHDLRTPMRNVKLLAEMLRDDFVDHGDGKMQLIESLVDVAQRSSELLTEVLSYTRTKQTEQTASHVYSFDAMCQNIVAALDPMSNHIIEFPDIMLYGDGVTLHIIVRNLIDNALKHSNRDQARVKINLDKIENGLLHFSIADNGVGLENPGAIFLSEGKFRAGTGFGLLAIKQLIASRGGSISAENITQGTGALINFTFPGDLRESDADATI